VTELPRSAAALRLKAEAAGWRVQITHSEEHDSTALRLSRGNQRAAAVWAGSKFRGAYVLGRLSEGSRSWPLPHRVGAREIAAHVEGES
jgi:hypothetical protein